MLARWRNWILSVEPIKTSDILVTMTKTKMIQATDIYPLLKNAAYLVSCNKNT